LRRRTASALPLLLACVALPVLAAGSAPGQEAAPPPGQEAATPPADLEALMARLAASGGVRARFHETKQLALLAAPLVTEGTLYFAPPDRLARHTVKPAASTVVVRGSRVTLRDENGTQTIDLGSSEAARQFVDNLGVLLRGDLEALRERYEVAFRAHADTWTLDLVPRSREVRRIVATIRVEGRSDVLTRMETREEGGDSTVTVFSDVETGLEFGPADLERYFSVDGRP